MVSFDIVDDPDVFTRRLGRMSQLDSASDADYVLEAFRAHGALMRFRITYHGKLKSGGKKPRLEDKAAIRLAISPQLKELWITHPGLQGVGFWMDQASMPTGREAESRRPRIDVSRPRIAPNNQPVLHALTRRIEIGGQFYLPLVRDSLGLTCGLDILFLRKDGPGPLVGEGGDLDNRIKTLFDGLRMPSLGEVDPTLNDGPGSTGDEPMYCLLEDDKLITDFTVRTDRLLTAPGASESEVLLVIDVIVRVSRLLNQNLGFLNE